MFKTGIYKLKDTRIKAKLFRKPLKKVSITLYDKILSEPNADELAERNCETPWQASKLG